MENKNLLACPSCAMPNDEFARSCRHCGALLTATSTLDPLNTIQAEGFMWRKSVEGRPKPIVLFVIWLIFLPWFLISAAMAISIISTEAGSGLNGFIFFWLSVGLAIVGFIFLYRVTYNFLTIPKRVLEEPVKFRDKRKLQNTIE